MATPQSIRDKAEAALARTDKLGVEMTRIFLSLDRARIMRDADKLDARVKAGESLPLAGVLCSIKDLIDRSGERTTAGSRLLEEASPAAIDSVVVERLEAAGALIFGRTNLTEFAYSGVGMNPHHGTPGCVFDRNRIPGGSSSGAALSVAHDLCDVAIGTDTGGSVRIPAAVNGVVGFKPTASLVPTEGVRPLSDSMDSIGPLAKDLDVALRTLAVLAGDDSLAPSDDAPEAAKLKIGVPTGWLTTDLEPAVESAWQATLAALKGAGVTLVDVDLEWLGDIGPANKIIVSVEAHLHYAKSLDALRKIGDPNVLERLRFAETVDEDTRKAAFATRRDAVARFERALEGLDALAAPTLAIVAPTQEAAKADFSAVNASMLRNCSAINFVDGCSVSLPAPAGDGYPEGMPGALMLSAPSGSDAALAKLATAIAGALHA